MIQTIGITEILIFYVAYFYKLFQQRRRGIRTNQLGKGDKSTRTVLVETLLRTASFIIVIITIISAMLNTTFYSNLFLRSLGLIILGTGTVLFILAMITMRDNWRAGIPDKDKTIMVTEGIFQFSRNPAFLGFDLTYLGSCIAFGNIVLLIIALITIILMHLQILEEEKFLERTFGQNYIAYKRKVSRYF